ncbi:lipopolysaccharide biosynthesis protein [Limosilactobacillus reuteri]|uniref:lipopolysaccharide biosynthesis protein n=1 Tax=Limosilactobacillus reuteri TaxID=1598 RepID=UPI00399667FF
MKKYIYLVKNMGLLTISNFGSKLLSFFLVPLYTSILTTRDYGIYDIFNTTIMLLIPILTSGMIDAVLRFPLTDRENKDEIYLIGLKHLLRGFFILVLVCLFNYFMPFSLILKQYGLLFIAMYFTAAISQMLQGYARGIEMVTALAVSGIIGSIAVITLNIWFLVYLKWGLVGYFLANIIGMAFTTVYLLFALDVWKVNPLKRIGNKKLEKEMLTYAIPTIANSISWWVNNAADRYIIIGLFGLATNGIYSVSYKIPSVMTVFQNIFNQAWSISAVQEFDPKDSSGFYKNIYRMTNFFMVIVCSGLIATTKIFAKILYQGHFFIAWKYVPFLLISVLFGSLVGILGGVFVAVKDSKKLGISTIVGAIVNVISGLVLSLLIGPIGAALGTTLSYIVVWIMRLIDIRKYMHLSINLYRDICTYILLFIQSLGILFTKGIVTTYSLQALFFIVIFIINYSEVKMLIIKFKH